MLAVLPAILSSPDIDSIVKKAMAENPSVGVQVSIAKDGKIIYEKGFGYADLEQSVKVDKNTVFHIDSISKHVTAGLILSLVEGHKVSLNDKVDKYVLGFPKPVPTVDQILSHTSGLKSYSDSPEFGNGGDRIEWTQNQILGIIKRDGTEFLPGSSWMYSNSAFYVAGLVAEKATGRSYAELIKHTLFEPFGMKQSCAGLNDVLVPHRARGYDLGQNGPVNSPDINWSAAFSAGYVCSTASDLLRFEIGLEKGKVVSADSLARMRSPHLMPDGTMLDYGLGTRLGALGGHRAIGHTGSGGGFNNTFVEFPDDHLSVAVLTNLDSAAVSRTICSAVSHRMLGLEEPKLVEQPLDSAANNAQFGIYRSSDGDFEVFKKDGKLHVRPAGSTGDGRIPPYLGNLRASTGKTGYVQGIEKNGRVIWLFFYDCGLLVDACPLVG